MKLRVLLLLCAAAWSVNVFAGCTAQQAQLVAPANGATNVASPVHFDWNDVSGGDSYRLLASFNGGTTNTIALTADSQYTVDVPAGTVDWWVEALGDSCTTVTTSAHFHFTAVGGTASCPSNPTAPSLQTPLNGATGLAAPVVLSWTAVTGSAGYHVFASVNGSQPAVVGTTTATQISVPFPQGSVTWFVEALFASCPSTFSGFATFSVATGACPNTPTTLIAPASGATIATSPVTFQWNRVAGAAAYKLYFGDDLVGVTTDTTLTRLVGEGTTTWRVDTTFAGCSDVRSEQFSFTVPSVSSCSGSIALQTPVENASVSSPATLSWSPIPSATAYRIWISVDGSAPVVLARSNNTSQTLPLPSGNIEWSVEALFASCPSILSLHGHFTVTRAATCGANQPPLLAAPVSGTQPQGPVTFSWNAAQGALLYRLWVSSDGDAFEDIGETNKTTLQQDVGTGTIQWYVEALFIGCPAVASNTATFTIPSSGCSNGTTLLISPAPNAAGVTAPVTLVWSAVQDAVEYRVWSKTAAGKNVVIATTGGDVTSITRNLPPGTIEWWVESDFDSCPGTKSTHSKFTIARAANCGTDVPQLVAPADGASTVASPVAFDWDPVNGAIGYAVIVRHNGGAPTLLAETTDSGVTKRLPEGTSEWWVIAFFPGCPPAESKHAAFSIPATACSTRQPILMTPADGATSLVSPVHFSWAPVPNAKSYKIWAAIDDEDPSVLKITTGNKALLDMPSGSVTWYVEATFSSCPSVISATSTFAVRKNAPACTTPARPAAGAPGRVASGTPFTIHWNAVANATNYELQESTALNFRNATTQVVSDVSTTLTRNATTQPVRYFYRVRADSNCNDEHGAYSKIVGVLVAPSVAASSSIDVGAQSGAAQQIALPPQNPPVTFSAQSDKPWITVAPSSGTVGAQGAILTVTFDPSVLKLGTNSGSITVTYGTSGPIRANGVQPVVPVSVSLVTPVTPSGKNTPPPDSLIIPAVGHAPGVNDSMFESDVRVANTSAQTQKYQLNFTLSGTDGTQSGQSTTIEINPGDTMALDDILSSFFGVSSDGAATGVLEIRPLTSTSGETSLNTSTPSIQTVASSRTFDTTTNGTFGQFIPAIPFSQFIAQGSRVSLQQIAQSAAYRTNIGLVEAAGEPATVLLHVLNDSGTEVATIPESLLPSEHLQLNNILPTLADGRVEVEVTSATGKVTAYASVIDNVTNDPLVVFPVTKGTVSASRYVVPGVADLNTGGAVWRSDLRLFNSGSSPVTATLTYSPQPGYPGATNSVDIPIQPGEVYAADNALQSLFGITQTGGSILITTPSTSGLVVTARTYDQTSNGTFGQFIPAVTPAQSVGSGDQALQLLQLESSDQYRTNIGLAETSGQPATAHISLIVPDSKFAISTDIPLAANEFQQISLASFGAGTVYNGRVTVSVTGGAGRVTAYGSVIDQITQDPTYVPAQ